MLFNNPYVIKSDADLRIGGVDVSGTEINYYDYINSIKNRMLRLVVGYVKYQMQDGATKEAAIKDTADLIYSYLYTSEKIYPTDEEGIVEEILKSSEYQNWETGIYYRFLDIHPGVVGLETAIPCKSENAMPISEEMEDNIWDLLEGLQSANFND